MKGEDALKKLQKFGLTIVLENAVESEKYIADRHVHLLTQSLIFQG